MPETERLLSAQFKYLRKLKRMKESKLRKLHEKTFKDSKYYVKVPTWMHRSALERRLFFFYCLLHYHYERTHPIAIEFCRKARHVLSAEYLAGLDPVEQAKQSLKEHANFTATNVKAMPIVEVDRYLASLSLYVEGDERIRRKVLWEWFNKPSDELIEHFNALGDKVSARRKGPLNNRFRLRDLILKNPRLCFNDFVDAFGQQMPTVSRFSFNNARCILRKAGYDIPVIPNTVGSAVVTGPYGQPKRGRILNDTTLLGVTEDGSEEEPF